ncbi:CapA family protein [Candidatus Poriferisodalis sp.]|uniref:CapA family protein n=1 Tax=Candidatus Poriferisodalis sp. TaxID=3101277 RepID=UPI003C7057D9
MQPRVAGLLAVLSAAVFASLAACSAPSGVPTQSESASSAPPASLADSDAAGTDVTATSTEPLSAVTPTVPPAARVQVSVPSHPAPRRARLVFTGDVLSHGPVTRQAHANGSSDLRYDYRPMFAQVRDSIASADLAICHLESPLSADNTDLSGYPLFNAPGDLAVGLSDAGYDGCSVASNHSLDRGIDGITATLEVLERHGLGHAGMARTPAEAAMPSIYVVNGIVIGHLSYTYGLNDIPLPPDRDWAVDVIDPDAIEAEAQAAVAAGAEFVILSIQWGPEYTSVPNASQRRLANNLLADSDIDLIVGSHAHVPQPIGKVGDKFVMFGLGNFLTNQSPLSCRSCPAATVDGVLVEVVLAETPAGRIEVAALGATPTWVDRPHYTVVDIAGELAGGIGPNRRGVLERSWQRTAGVLRAEGVDIVIEGDPAGTQAISGAPDIPSAWPLALR